ncbi:hypothetical protein JAAARDRAFT_48162 [Jaapia argillacea MUCL 33604]|uniref:Chitin-binding type-4 domain-containing protein n=1 Tax=Jaapia argillacea MUCL 33604 TaxID=933084 RepID=A0A067Q0U4_9AGAM|nr:hypothetical protein JAAARDRAFT_48162 [Jaapia argillacea MUCL 33604]
MFAKLSVLATLLAVASTAVAHGVISSPPRRQASLRCYQRPGTNFEAICGTQIYNNVESDQYGNQQLEEQNIGTDTTYSDNTANVQHYPANTVVPITISLRAPHTGVANVSVVYTPTNTMLTPTLIYFDPAYSVSTAIPANQTSFSVTVPNLNGKCATAGDCVLQWWWDARSIDQT